MVGAIRRGCLPRARILATDSVLHTQEVKHRESTKAPRWILGAFSILETQLERIREMMLTIGELRAFRDELVAAEREHPEWRKVRPCPWNALCMAVPDSPGAEAYWKLRNGTQGIVRHWANELDDLSGRPGYVRDVCQMDPNGRLDLEEERLVSKWMDEWEELKAAYL